jgi:hypothetical protein
MFDMLERWRAEVAHHAAPGAPSAPAARRSPPPTRDLTAEPETEVDWRGQRERELLGEDYVYGYGEPTTADPADPLKLGSKPNVLAAHGRERDETITADRPVTFYTQSGYALPENLAVGVENDSPALVEAWSAWSDHVAQGGTREDFEPEGDLASFWNIWALEGARSELPGTEFKDLDLSPLAPGDRRAPTSSTVKGERWKPDHQVSLGEILERGLIPGDHPLVVAACRGEDLFLDPTLPKEARAA